MQVWVILMDGNIYAIHREENTAKAEREDPNLKWSIEERRVVDK